MMLRTIRTCSDEINQLRLIQATRLHRIPESLPVVVIVKFVAHEVRDGKIFPTNGILLKHPRNNDIRIGKVFLLGLVVLRISTPQLPIMTKGDQVDDTFLWAPAPLNIRLLNNLVNNPDIRFGILDTVRDFAEYV
jgi:hypothetical protein